MEVLFSNHKQVKSLLMKGSKTELEKIWIEKPIYSKSEIFIICFHKEV